MCQISTLRTLTNNPLTHTHTHTQGVCVCVHTLKRRIDTQRRRCFRWFFFWLIATLCARIVRDLMMMNLVGKCFQCVVVQCCCCSLIFFSSSFLGFGPISSCARTVLVMNHIFLLDKLFLLICVWFVAPVSWFIEKEDKHKKKHYVVGRVYTFFISFTIHQLYSGQSSWLN